MRTVLGLDGGGSKVVCLAADEGGRLLGRGQGGPVNTNYVLFQEAADAAVGAIDGALAGAGLCGEDVALMVLSAPLDPQTLADVIRRTKIRQVVRAAEGETPRWAACFWIDKRIGVTVDAGTGSLSRGYAADGREAGAGGFGTMIGDEGSGAWISLRAISSVLQAHDGRLERTLLTDLAVEHFRLPRVQDLIFRVSGGFITTAKAIEARETRERVRFAIDSGHVIGPQGSESEGGLLFSRIEEIEPLTRAQVAGFCPKVVWAARQGDALALRILQEAGVELGRLAAAVIRKLEMGEEEFAIVPFGGVFKAGELVRRSFEETCLQAAPRASIVEPRFEPEVGAVLIALDKIGVQVDEKVLRAVEQSASGRALQPPPS